MTMYRARYQAMCLLGPRNSALLSRDRERCLQSRFLFVHVPKTAGKSMRQVLFGRPDGACHLRMIDYRKVFRGELETLFKFAFVRHPMDRLISAYEYLKDGGNGQGSDLRFKKRHMDGIPDLQSFVMEWLSRDKLYSMCHFIPQHEFLYVGDSIGADFIGRYERLDEDFGYVAARLGMEASTLSHVNASRRKGRAYEVGPAVAKKVRDLYASDFRLFGYF